MEKPDTDEGTYYVVSRFAAWLTIGLAICIGLVWGFLAGVLVMT